MFNLSRSVVGVFIKEKKIYTVFGLNCLDMSCFSGID